ncbi:MAG TPA: hypothetical protein VLA89_15880 [Gemmatimonadales bacterium]|nr:hypothetical protein [Gemmatimonadales bacterium]
MPEPYSYTNTKKKQPTGGTRYRGGSASLTPQAGVQYTSNTNRVLPPSSPIQKTSFDPARPDDPNRTSAGVRSQAADAAAGTAGQSGAGNGYQGFASRYLEGPGTADILQRQPEVVLADWMRSQGLNPNGGMFGMVEPSADLANALYMLTNGSQLGTNEQMINWLANYFGTQLTPGASGIDVRQALANIFAGPGQNQQTPLGSFLTLDPSTGMPLDPRGQVAKLGSLVEAAAGYGVPLIMQGALNGSMGLLGRDYLSAAARGALSGGNYNDYINARQNNILAPFIGRG